MNDAHQYTAVYDVLLVDDDSDLREMLAQKLSADGYSVVTATNGMEAIRSLSSPGMPRLIVLDLLMPHMTGEEFLRVQRAYLRWSLIPVIVLTGLTRPTLATLLGVEAVLEKPIDAEDFLAAVRSLCPVK